MKFFIAISSLLFLVHLTHSTQDITMIKMVQQTPDEVENYYKIKSLRVKKYNRTAHVVNAEFEMMQDCDDSFMFEAEMYYSRARNTQWTKSPANVPPTAYCKIMDKYFLGGLDADFKDKSSIPQLAYCPLPKGPYDMKDVLIHHSRFPNNIEEGLYLINATLKHNNEILYQVHVVADVEQNPE